MFAMTNILIAMQNKTFSYHQLQKNLYTTTKRQVKQMKSSAQEMWKTNIENAASTVAAEYGNAVV